MLTIPRAQLTISFNLTGVFHKPGVTQSSSSKRTTSFRAERECLRQVEDVQRSGAGLGVVPRDAADSCSPQLTTESFSRSLWSSYERRYPKER